ncbi:MAG: GNAT family N-acetyltransferase [Rikenellaceae bacterium]
MTEIRSASHSDIQLINSLAKDIFNDTYQSILSPDQVVYMFDMMYSPVNIEKQMAAGHKYHIIESDGVPQGYLSVRKVADCHYYIEKIYTLPSVHGSGIGRTLFEFACHYARAGSNNQECLLELNVNRNNARAIKFYTKMGMHPDRRTDEHVGSGYYANDYVMAITL